MADVGAFEIAPLHGPSPRPLELRLGQFDRPERHAPKLFRSNHAGTISLIGAKASRTSVRLRSISTTRRTPERGWPREWHAAELEAKAARNGYDRGQRNAGPGGYGVQRMKICVFGAGAVGSHFAARLADAGHDVSCVMRGPHLEAVRANGLALRSGDERLNAKVRATDDPSALGSQDLVISTLKANALGSLADGLKPLIKDDTGVVFAQNGIPWWYNVGLPADHPPTPSLDFLDPGGRLRALLPKERVIGGVIFSSNEIVEPGVVVNDSPERNMLIVGECDDRQSDRIHVLRQTLATARLQSPPTERIRETIWTKLITNMTLSILCVLTGKDIRDTVQDPAIEPLVPRLLAEGQAVGQACYPALAQRSRSVPAIPHKPSILQDCERGRPMEIDALITAPLSFARTAGIATPMLDLMAGLAIRQARERGLYA
jgi:2-dehydropantoate 2-reductase